MRKYPAVLNRTALLVIGVVLVFGGLWALWPWAGRTMGWTTPEWAAGLTADAETAIAPGATDALEQPWLPAAAIAAGAILLLLGVGWLLRQLPRTGRAGTLRFTEDTSTGTTTMEPRVLEAAAADAAGALPQVRSAHAVLRGSAGAPDLLLYVEAEPSANLGELTRTLEAGVAADVALSLGRPLEHLAIEYSVARDASPVLAGE